MHKTYIIGIVIVCASILFSAYILSHSKLDINNLENEHSISVQGQGEVFVTPDTVILNINIEEKNQPSTKDVQKRINEKTTNVKDILSKFNIKESDIKTLHTSTFEDYDRTDNGRISKGFAGSLSMQIKIKNANQDNKGLESKIISEISNINGVFINNISYDIYDKSEYYSQARELAIEKAHQKAEELAKYAGVNLGKAISISEGWSNDYALPTANSFKMMDNGIEVDEEEALDSEISLGEMDIKLNVSVVYSIK